MANPSVYTVELRNKTFDLIKVMTKDVKGLTWDYNRIGGCGACTLQLALSELADVGADYDIQIRLEDGQGATNLVYRGYVDSERPVVDVNNSIELRAFGYSGQLGRVRVKETYTAQEVSVIVKDILDTYVLPETSIIYDAADIEASTFTVDSIEFDTMADSALKTLAELAGSIEWGVNRNRKFFFKAQDNDVRHYAKYKIDVDKYDNINDYSGIVNRLYIKGGKVAGVTFEDTVNNTESQTNYGLRSEIVSNSSIVTSGVAQRYGTMVLADKARVQVKATIKIAKSTRFFEETIPVGKINIIGTSVALAKYYGDSDAIYGDFRYGGVSNLQIGKITYKVADEGLDINMTAGFARPDVAEQIKKLTFEIDQLRNM